MPKPTAFGSQIHINNLCLTINGLSESMTFICYTSMIITSENLPSYNTHVTNLTSNTDKRNIIKFIMTQYNAHYIYDIVISKSNGL